MKVRKARHRSINRFIKGNLFISKILFAVLFIGWCLQAKSQVVLNNNFAAINERVIYNTHFKWGGIKPRAGEASMTYGYYASGYRARVLFKTSSFFDNIYKMRDTLECYYNNSLLLTQGSKRVVENGTASIDNYQYKYSGGNTYAHMTRYKSGELTLDSTIMARKGLDMVALVMDVRSKKWENIASETAFTYNVFSGRSVVPVTLRYIGKEVIEVNKRKFNSYKIAVFVKDKAFAGDGQKADTFFWLSADRNKILLMGSMALKVGYAKIYVSNIMNTRYPLTSEIK